MRRKRLPIVLAAIGVCLLLLIGFDEVWLRPLIQHVVRTHSGRRIDFEALHLGISPSWHPTIEFDGLQVQNAPWARPAPLVRAGKARAEFAWHRLDTGEWVVRRMTLVDAELDLERQADGLRNWRLMNPDDRGPGKIKVMSIDAQRSRVRFLHDGIGLDLDITSSPLGTSRPLAGQPQLPLTRHLSYRGTLAKQGFEGEADVGDVLTFQRTSERFGLDGRIRSGGAELIATGAVADMFADASLDVDLSLKAPKLVVLQLLWRSASLPALGPVSAKAHLVKADRAWKLSGLEGVLAHSDLAGDLEYHAPDTTQGKSGERRALRATLRSDSIDLADIGSWRRGAASESAGHSGPGTGSSRTGELSKSRLDFSWLHNAEAEVEFHIGRLVEARQAYAEQVHVKAALKNDRLSIAPLQAAFAGGDLSGHLAVDADRSPAAVELRLDAKGLKSDRLPRQTAASSKAGGELDGRLDLRARGDSPFDLASSASGTATARLSHAFITRRLDAELSLDGLAFIRSLFGGTDRVPVECADAVVDFDAGQGRIRRLALDTERTSISGRGRIALAEQSFDVRLTPESRTSALLALEKDIRVHGSLGSGTKVSLEKRTEGAFDRHCGSRPAPAGSASGTRSANSASRP